MAKIEFESAKKSPADAGKLRTATEDKGIVQQVERSHLQMPASFVRQPRIRG
jgi:hypothetical protein